MKLSTLGALALSLAFMAPQANAQDRLQGKPSTPTATASSLLGSIVADGSFEGGTPNAAWDEASASFGSPLCDLAACGTGGGTAAPRTGDFYVWFGGSGTGDVGSMTQTVTVPTATSATLDFWLKIPVIAAGGTGFVAASMDGTEVFRATYADDQPTYTEYALVSVDASAYADGMSHVLSLNSTTTGGGNFYVDDVSIELAVTGPSLLVSPGTVAFGDVRIGMMGTRTVNITNNGSAAVNLASVTYAGDASITASSVAAATLAPGDTRAVTLTFSPTAAGAASGTLTVTSDAPGSPVVVNVTGNGTVAPVAPANDNIANATPITMTTATLTGTNNLATLEAGEPVASCQASSGASVWWSYTPSSDGRITVSLDGSTFDTVLTLHQPGTTEVGCDDDGGAGLQSLVTDAPVVAGQQVLIRVAGFVGFAGTAAQGDIALAFTFTGTTAGENGVDAARTYLSAAPNPVRGTSAIRFASATAQDVTVAVYDMMGRQITTLFQGALAADQPVEASLDATDLPSGVYVVRATGSDLALTQRVTVVR